MCASMFLLDLGAKEGVVGVLPAADPELDVVERVGLLAPGPRHPPPRRLGVVAVKLHLGLREANRPHCMQNVCQTLG